MQELINARPSADYPANDRNYQSHLISQYKMYVATAEKVSDRRQKANGYFLALNSAILGFVGYAIPKEEASYLWLIGIAGITLSYLWYRIIRSFRGLNSGKFDVIAQIEKHLPMQPFRAEWVAIGEGKVPGKYLPVSHIEERVPWVFMALHLVVIGRSLWPWLVHWRG